MSMSSKSAIARRRSAFAAGVVLALGAAGLASIQTDAVAARPNGAAKAGIVVGAERAASAARPTTSQGPPAVAWNGSRYFVVWSEGAADGTTSIYGARVSPSGAVLDPAGILLGSGDEFETVSNPTVAGGGGKFFVVWEREPEGTYDDLDAALVTNAGVVQRQWGLTFVDNQQSNPVAAWNGKLFLAVWEDQPDATQQDIFGARVTRDGLTLDGCSSDSCPNGDDPGIAISVGPNDETAPAVAANDDYFVAAWTDANTATPTDIRDAGVAVNGSILAFGSTFDISTAAGAQSQPSIARSGDTFLIAWSDRRSDPSSDVYSTLIQPGSEFDFDSTPLSPNGVLVSAANRAQSMPSVARRGTGYVVVWLDRRNSTFDVYGSRVGPAGAVLDPAGVPIAASNRIETDPAAVAGSGNQLVAYRHPTSAGATRVFFRLLT
jgi:hypothetical protein